MPYCAPWTIWTLVYAGTHPLLSFHRVRGRFRSGSVAMSRCKRTTRSWAKSRAFFKVLGLVGSQCIFVSETGPGYTNGHSDEEDHHNSMKLEEPGILPQPCLWEEFGAAKGVHLTSGKHAISTHKRVDAQSPTTRMSQWS